MQRFFILCGFFFCGSLSLWASPPVLNLLSSTFESPNFLSNYPFLSTFKGWEFGLEGGAESVWENKTLSTYASYSTARHLFGVDFSYKGSAFFNLQKGDIFYAYRFPKYFTLSIKTGCFYYNAKAEKMLYPEIQSQLGLSYFWREKLSVYAFGTFSIPLYTSASVYKRLYEMGAGIDYRIGKSFSIGAEYVLTPSLPSRLDLQMAYQVLPYLAFSLSCDVLRLKNELNIIYAKPSFSCGIAITQQIRLGFGSRFFINYRIHPKEYKNDGKWIK